MATSPVSVLGMPGLNLVDANTTSYGLGGQMSPDEALQAQALNRKRQIANLLIQRGLQQPQGQMAGRFYVPPSWAQGLNQAGGMIAGALLNKQFDAEQKALSDQSKNDVAVALANFRTQTGPQTQTLEQEGPGAPVEHPYRISGETSVQGMFPGADPLTLPNTFDIDALQPPVKPPIFYKSGDSLPPWAGPYEPSDSDGYKSPLQQIPEGLAKIGQAFMPPAEPVKPYNRDQYVFAPWSEEGTYRTEGPRPTTDIQVPATPEQRQQALIDLLANQHPQVRALGQLLFAQDERKAEKAENRAFQEQEKALDREVRREGIEANALTRLEMMRNTLAMKEMQLAQDERTGIRNDRLRKDIQDQTIEMRKLEMQSRETLARQHDETLKGIAALNVEGKKDALAQKEQAKIDKVDAGRNTVSSLVATLRDAYNQLDEAGGITNPEKSGLENAMAWPGTTGAGQVVGKMFGTKNQSLRNQIAQQRPLLLNAIKEATGMSAKQMDSNAELKMYLSAATDPALDVKANRAALDKLEELYGLSGGPSSAPSAPMKAAEPSLDDLLNKYK